MKVKQVYIWDLTPAGFHDKMEPYFQKGWTMVPSTYTVTPNQFNSLSLFSVFMEKMDE